MSQLQNLPCEPLHLNDGRGAEGLHVGQLEEGETGTPWQRVTPRRVCFQYLAGGAESGGQDSCLHVTEGRRGDLSLHNGGPANLEIYLDLINIPKL